MGLVSDDDSGIWVWCEIHFFSVRSFHAWLYLLGFFGISDSSDHDDLDLDSCIHIRIGFYLPFCWVSDQKDSSYLGTLEASFECVFASSNRLTKVLKS